MLHIREISRNGVAKLAKMLSDNTLISRRHSETGLNHFYSIKPIDAVSVNRESSVTISEFKDRPSGLLDSSSKERPLIIASYGRTPFPLDPRKAIPAAAWQITPLATLPAQGGKAKLSKIPIETDVSIEIIDNVVYFSGSYKLEQ